MFRWRLTRLGDVRRIVQADPQKLRGSGNGRSESDSVDGKPGRRGCSPLRRGEGIGTAAHDRDDIWRDVTQIGDLLAEQRAGPGDAIAEREADKSHGASTTRKARRPSACTNDKLR